MNDLKKNYVFENTDVSTPNKRTVILAKDSQCYSPQNEEDAGDGICVEEMQIIKIHNKEIQTDVPRDIILQELEELKKLNIQILKEVNLLKSGTFIS